MNELSTRQKIYKIIGWIIRKIKRPYRFPKKINERSFSTVKHVEDKNINYIHNSCTIMKLDSETGPLYFRECERHYCSLKKYIFYLTDYYYEVLCAEREFAEQDKAIVIKSLSNKTNYKKFLNMGFWYNKKTTISLYLKGKKDSLALGIDYIDANFQNRVREFVRFVSYKVMIYRWNDYLFAGKYHSFFSNKNFAYEKMASLLNVGYFSTHNSYLTLETDHGRFCGFVADEAQGVMASSFAQKEVANKVTLKLQNQFIKLTLLDYLCLIRDHRPDNYNVLFDDKKNFVNICCFDNDEPDCFGFERFTDYESYFGVKLFDADGFINRPHVDKAFAEQILQLTKKNLIVAVGDCLRREQIKRIYERLIVLQKAIVKTAEKNKNFLISEEEWTEEALRDELNGRYGKTYLTIFVFQDQ